MTYATTPLFLEYFGLRNLDELPAADELRRIPVQKPEALVTAETAPEGQQQNAEGAPTSGGEQPAIVPADTATESSAVSPESSGSETSASSNPESELPR
jgi:segregation and condensation protein B